MRQFLSHFWRQAASSRPVDSSGGKVYYSTRGNSIYVANLDGSNATPLVTNQTTVHGIAIDVTAGWLIYRAFD